MFEYCTLNCPTVYKTPDLKEGDKAVIHIIQPNYQFINLKFDEKKDIKNIPNLIVDNINTFSDKKIKASIKRIEGIVLQLGGVYTCYSYLFVCDNKIISLVSVALEDSTMGFVATTKISEHLDIPCLKPNWSGIFVQQVAHAFYENIFVSKH